MLKFLQMILNTNIKLFLQLRILLCCLFWLILFSCSKPDVDFYSGLTASQIYQQGRAHVQQKKFSDAIKDFQALEVNYPYGIYADKAKLSLIYCYYIQKDYPQVKAVTDRFLRAYPNHIHADYVHYMQGVAGYEQYYSTMYRLFNVDRSKREPKLAIQAFDDFKIMLERSPNSRYSMDARMRMIHLKNQIALTDLHIAKFYLAKGAHIAAVNRAKDVLVNFNDTIVVKEALEVMIEAYHKLNMPELEKQTRDLLNVNFASININSVTKKK